MSIGGGPIGEAPIAAEPPDDLFVIVQPSASVTATAGPLVAVVVPGKNVSSQVTATVDPTAQEFSASGAAFFTVHNTLTRVVTTADSPYQIISGTVVRYNPAGAITLDCPASPVANDWFVIKNERAVIALADLVTLDAGAGVEIEVVNAVETPLLVTGSFTFLPRPASSYKYIFHQDFGWVIDHSYVPGPLEPPDLWQATPIVGLSGQTIQWTFVPLFTGQTPKYSTEASGVFTFVKDQGLSLSYQGEFQMNLDTNNADVDWSVTPAFTGGGVHLLARMIDAFAHARSGTFFRDKSKDGVAFVLNNDTLQFSGTSAGTGLSDVDLDSMVLSMDPN